jgi:orotate phosphoribosyltransferase
VTGPAVTALLAAREGHYRFESGHHGRLALDLDSAFWDPAAVEPLTAALAARLAPHGAAAVVAPLTGGALLGYGVAARLGVPFASTARRAGPRPPDALYAASYELPAVLRPRLRGLRVALVDDVVNAGSAVRSSAAAVTASGGTPVAVGTLLRLGDTALSQPGLAGLPFESLAVRPHELWEPAVCPLCARGEPVTDVP